MSRLVVHSQPAAGVRKSFARVGLSAHSQDEIRRIAAIGDLRMFLTECTYMSTSSGYALAFAISHMVLRNITFDGTGIYNLSEIGYPAVAQELYNVARSTAAYRSLEYDISPRGVHELRTVRLRGADWGNYTEAWWLRNYVNNTYASALFGSGLASISPNTSIGGAMVYDKGQAEFLLTLCVFIFHNTMVNVVT